MNYIPSVFTEVISFCLAKYGYTRQEGDGEFFLIKINYWAPFVGADADFCILNFTLHVETCFFLFSKFGKSELMTKWTREGMTWFILFTKKNNNNKNGQ